MLPEPSAAALRDAILWALRHPERLCAMSERARARAKDFDPARVVEQLREMGARRFVAPRTSAREPSGACAPFPARPASRSPARRSSAGAVLAVALTPVEYAPPGAMFWPAAVLSASLLAIPLMRGVLEGL